MNFDNKTNEELFSEMKELERQQNELEDKIDLYLKELERRVEKAEKQKEDDLYGDFDSDVF